MSTFQRLSEVYRRSEEVLFDNSSKIVLISDCHRGDGSWVDDFSHNQTIYYSALKQYYDSGFTYIELGDGDELLKNRNFTEICNIYTDVFRLLHEFYRDKRLYMLYGNHDADKSEPGFVKKNLQSFYNRQTDRNEPLFDNIKIHEGLILKHQETGKKLFLIHGHQGDLINDVFWRLGRFLVRHFWRRLEFIGLKDPTSAAMNYDLKKKIEKKIIEWAQTNHQIVIAGHTHRPACPSKEAAPYFNDGSCVHPTSITAIEIENAEITLVKWGIKTKEDRSIYVDREVIAVPRKIKEINSR